MTSRALWYPEKPAIRKKVKELPTLKDMDFLNKNQKVYTGEEEKKVFLEKLKRDVEFLVQLKIMDYSLYWASTTSFGALNRRKRGL